MKKTFKRLGLLVLVLGIGAFLAPSESEKKEALNKEIKQLEKSILKSDKLDMENNFYAYKKLSNYYPKNKEYKKSFEFYKSRYELESKCRIETRQRDKKSLKTKESYNEKNKLGKWATSENFMMISLFTGNNDFGKDIEYKSTYKCTKEKNNLYIKKIALVKN